MVSLGYERVSAGAISPSPAKSYASRRLARNAPSRTWPRTIAGLRRTRPAHGDRAIVRL